MWLAPLPVPADAAASQGCCNGKQPRAERALVERTEAEDDAEGANRIDTGSGDA